MEKRTFLKSLPFLGSFARSMVDPKNYKPIISPDIPAEKLAKDEKFWHSIRREFRIKPDYINLENGYYCFVPEFTLEKFIQHIRHINYEASYYMRTVQGDNKRKIVKLLSKEAGCDEEELIITRNTTESLDTVISGFPWKEGDEAIMAEQDYGSMLNQFELLAQRKGIVNKRISVPNHPSSDEEIVWLYEKSITPRTKLIMVSHMINITGQILPVNKICNMAHSYGVEVLVDGAHAFGHFQFSLSELDCDYYGTSLHKWLSAPLGSGFLFVKKKHIGKIQPLFADWDLNEKSLNFLNHTGTHPVFTDLAILNALEFQNYIGLDKKEARLRHLQNYWKEKLKENPDVIINTPMEPHRSCAIGNIGLKNTPPGKLAHRLFQEFRIWTTAIDREKAGVHGCRITPNLYTTINELDEFVNAMQYLSKV
ncbi:MAG TPA: aminotransferase class V-fold PLP-dependent enzyme [Saprospiraceae bacterium]|nr:aminotransferase class V-fold PLP-dependent enzyme [Saprospiraceae bacterium]